MNVRPRLERLERNRLSGTDEPVEIWNQDMSGADRYTSPARPGEVRTAADFGDEPPPEGIVRVYLVNFGPKVTP